MPPQKLELTWFNKDKALIPTETGKYGYTWVDPRDPRYCETHTLTVLETVTGRRNEKRDGVQYGERADLEPQSDNLLIQGESGDVLEALTRVPELRDKYVGKVKCVYIDPPFNTAQTFTHYEDNLEHSVWLTMMRDRLLHLRDLLSEDGSIWVHLDDVENHRMRMLMDEVFGSGNFVTEVVWEKTYSPRNDSKGIPAVTDTILVYRKSDQFSPNRLPRTAEMDGRYKNPDGDIKGAWKSADTTAPLAQERGYFGGIQHPISGELIYPPGSRHWVLSYSRILTSISEYGNYIAVPPSEDSLFRRAQLMGIPVEEVRSDMPDLVLATDPETFPSRSAVDRIESGNWPEMYFSQKSIGRKAHLSEVAGRIAANFLPHSEVGHNDGAIKEIRALFPGQNPFTTPKPERLLERIIHIATNPGDVVLDVFAGSGTTAAVAQKMGRRWVTCELLEDTFNRFTLPRLTKVVNGQDMGGISTSKSERIDDTDNGLPEGMTPDEAQKLTSLLNKAIKEHDDLKKSADIKALKALVKTKNSGDVVNWLGGGGFTVAKLAPSCYDYTPETGYTHLTDAATGETLIASVAANLGFHLSASDPHFSGRRNNEHLAVVEGVLTEAKVGDLMAHLPEGHSILFAATNLDEGVRDVVRSYKNGSRVVHVPLDLFPFGEEEEN
ncbi:site-specific DNA-methyltransferase [Corynebacterium epidermidicanis]|uniref:Adenine specific DNA methylase Mod n=1 Tax=Corynebacterium epidermidicanis TaxID=1050174 RepID=A0A0G3GSM1_9CORY|nr:site-specific DNA-methyltransferase [Corynebacterium epidermidicanis]AKK03580.1 adenine specific DNA methylase Mod [Corynebacterium epidermidicanis]